MPKKIARSQLKSRLYDALENHWYAMVWEDENGSTMDADIWWDETFEWLKNVPLEKINHAVPFPTTRTKPLSCNDPNLVCFSFFCSNITIYRCRQKKVDVDFA